MHLQQAEFRLVRFPTTLNDNGSRKAVERVYLHRHRKAYFRIGGKRGGHSHSLHSTRACSHVRSWNFGIWRIVNLRLYLRDSEPEPETFLALLKQSSLRDGENGEIWQKFWETRIFWRTFATLVYYEMAVNSRRISPVAWPTRPWNAGLPISGRYSARLNKTTALFFSPVY